MTNQNKTLNQLTIDELKNFILDLQSGVRYNDIKAKYNMPQFVFTNDTIAQCKHLIAEKEFSQPRKAVKALTPEQAKQLVFGNTAVVGDDGTVWF